MVKYFSFPKLIWVKETEIIKGLPSLWSLCSSNPEKYMGLNSSSWSSQLVMNSFLSFLHLFVYLRLLFCWLGPATTSISAVPSASPSSTASSVLFIFWPQLHYDMIIMDKVLCLNQYQTNLLSRSQLLQSWSFKSLSNFFSVLLFPVTRC